MILSSRHARFSAPSCLVGLFAGIALLASCGPADSEADPADTTRPPFEVAAEPALSVGVVEGEAMEQLDRVATPFLLPDGRLVVPNRGSSSIRIFSADGDFQESLGGPGEGPGEFSGLRAAWRRGDTIEAWDSDAHRITRFLPDGTTETVTVRAEGNLDAGVGPLGDGWALVALGLGNPRDRVVLESFDPSGAHRATVAELAGMARYRTGSATGPHPITPITVAATHGDELYAAETDHPVVRVYGPDGALRREISLPLTPSGAPGDVLTLVIDSAVARAPDDEKRRVRERLAAFPQAESVPVLQSLLVDEQGLLWVRPWKPFRHALALGGRADGRPGPGGTWFVLDPGGAVLGQATMPDGLEPLAITDDAVVGVHRDELDVESVRIHRLTRSTGGR